jgi:hypothetical protein
MDFGITQDKNGNLMPMLIEVQGFPSLYFYQDLVARSYRKFFDVPKEVTHLFDGLDTEAYVELMRHVILRDEKPENVVLLEIEPDYQVTRIDYLGTRHEVGLHVICVSDLKKSGNDVYYINEHGKKIQVHRIYNRVIFDELSQRPDLKTEFIFTDDCNVSWAGHPNWFFRISKHTMPFLDSQFVPKTYFLDKLDKIPDNLENFVLKPLFSFSGTGVKYHVSRADVESIENPSNFILQEKVNYLPVVKSPDGDVKCEIRMLMVWEPGTSRPRIVNNLARLSKGEMIGVRYNKDKTWVGGSVAFFNK